MSKWGKERSFVTDKCFVRIIADVDTGHNPFNPIDKDSTVATLLLTNIRSGAAQDAKVLLESLKEKYVGKPYTDWTNGLHDG